MERDDVDTGEIITTRPHPYFHSKNEVILAATDLEEVYDNAVERIKEEIANFQRQGSGWRFKNVVKLGIYTTVYEPLRDNSYIPLPKKLKNKKAIINPQNSEDEECFKMVYNYSTKLSRRAKKSIQNKSIPAKTS